jgi:hypothetical protein
MDIRTDGGGAAPTGKQLRHVVWITHEGVYIMKFLITWQMHEGKLHDTLALFSEMSAEQEEGMMGNKLKLIGRWHDLVRGTGVAVYEADSVDAISAYSLNWNRFMDLDIVPVVNDEETREIGRSVLASG